MCIYDVLSSVDTVVVVHLTRQIGQIIYINLAGQR